MICTTKAKSMAAEGATELERVRQALAASSTPESSGLVAPGDTIDVRGQGGFLRGHGTQVEEGELKATVCGTVEKVNKLVTVLPLRGRYAPETGDVVVGRVTELSPKRWRMEIGSKQEAMLALSAVTLPGGEQRRRTAMDELSMREMYAEGDLVVAEVQSVGADSLAQLHTRSSKYGKLVDGQLATVPSSLVQRRKQHFFTLEAHGAGVTLGRNGWIWVESVQESGRERAREARESVARVANAARALGRAFVPVNPDTLADVCEAATAWSVPIKDMANDAFIARFLERFSERQASAHR